ncbi:MAG TPA: hypothetical protein DCQ25_12240 [Elusimicrobia bacterium]|nr:hypothetical protein [Elusimicrobiota bacterium]
MLLVAGAMAYHAHYRASLRASAEQLLLSTTQIKLDQLKDWRADRLNDTMSLLDSPVLGLYLRRFAADRTDKETAGLLRERLWSYLRHNPYRFVAIADEKGKVLLSAGRKPEVTCTQFLALIPKALRSGRPEMGDFYFSEEENSPHIDIVAPALPGSKTAGLLLLLRVDPTDFLYPLLKTWSASGETGEILLVTRSGDDVLFLNDVRHVPGAALRLRRPITEMELPAALALRGRSGIVKGQDYRGVEVLAAVSPVPGTSWGLVTKLDWSEVMRGSGSLGALLALLVLALTGAAGSGAFLTFRRQAEKTEEMLARLTDQVPGVVYQYRLYPDGRSCFPYSSSGIRQIYEVTSDEVREDATPVFGRLHPEDLKATSGAIFASARDLSVFQWEFRVVLPKQGLRWRLCDARPERLPDGGTLWHGIITDITDRKLAEEALRKSERDLKEAQRLARLGNWTLDLLSNKLEWSEEIFRIFEIDRDKFEASYEAFLDGIHPEDRAAVNKAYTESLKNRTPYSIVHRLLMKDGRVKYVSEFCETFYGADGKPLRSVGTVQDITERRMAEEALIKSEAAVRSKLQALLSPEGEPGTLELGDILDVPELQAIMDEFYGLTKIGIGIIDMKGKVLVGTGWQEICTRFHRVNPETARNCVESDTILSDGVERGKCKSYLCKNNLRDIATPIVVGGRHLGNLFLGQFLYTDEPYNPELFREQARRYGFDEEAYVAAYERLPRFTREQVDTVMRFYTRFSELISTLSYGKIKLARALAQSRQAEQEKEGLNKALAAKNSEMENFLYITTHDLRSPLVNIQGFSQNLQGYLAEMRQVLAGAGLGPEDGERAARLYGEKVPEALGFILESSAKMDALLSALLKVSRMGRQELKPENLEMGPVLRRIVDTMRFQVEQACAEVKVGALPPCRADAVSVSQLFSNLLDNALKYRDPQRRLVIEVSGEAAAGKAVYRVADNGPGIPEAEHGKLWSIFYKPARAGRKNGEGIGLPMCRRIAERNGGSISVAAAPGGGTVFVVELPLA